VQSMISESRSSTFLDMAESFQWVTAAMPEGAANLRRGTCRVNTVRTHVPT
jgi:hypothetical protein